MKKIKAQSVSGPVSKLEKAQVQVTSLVTECVLDECLYVHTFVSHDMYIYCVLSIRPVSILAKALASLFNIYILTFISISFFSSMTPAPAAMSSG